ncbi:MAG: chromate transporter [Tissierellia bacterium]|nr:chromate transporter [Tissierellia bacterium]
MTPSISYSHLFWVFLKINSFTFGGGYTIVPIVREYFVEKEPLIEEKEMLDLVALAQSGPGAMAISLSLLTGYRLRGVGGALVCALASCLPCLVIITIISGFYQAFRDNPYIAAMLTGISGVISAVLFLTTFNMAKTALKIYPVFSSLMMGLAFVLGFFTSLNTGLIILLLALIGLVTFSLNRKDV